MVAAARYIKKNEPDAKVVFIGPCTAKKSEAVRLGVSDAVDYVLTFEELLALFEAFNVNHLNVKRKMLMMHLYLEEILVLLEG